jgi:hypothetical protein
MKIIVSPIEAVREIKELSKEMSEFDTLYLCFNEASEKFYVSDDDTDIEEQIRKSFDGGDSADSHARMFRVWTYRPAHYKEKYPNTYKHAVTSVIEGLIRLEAEVIPEYSVSFNIS